MNKDIKYFNASEKHEVDYAKTFKRRKKTYSKFDDGGGVGVNPISYTEDKKTKGLFWVEFSDGENVLVDYSLSEFKDNMKGMSEKEKKDYIFLQAKENYNNYAGGGGVGESEPEGYRYLTLQKVKGGLKVSIDDEGIELVTELKADGKYDIDIWIELFEDIQGNSEYIFHPDMGESGFGMTSAEGITDGYYYEGEDISNLYKTDYPKSAKVYWFPNYMVESSLDTMIEKGSVVFIEAEEMKDGGIAEGNAEIMEYKGKRIYKFTVPFGYPVINKIRDLFAENEGKINKDVWDNTLKTLNKTNPSFYKILNKEWKDFKETMEIEVVDGKYVNPYYFKNGGGVGENEEFDYGGTTMTDENTIIQNINNGEIHQDTLEEIIGHKPKYPYEVVGSITLSKCFLRPYYKID